jgi:2-aminoadipate transaminase
MARALAKPDLISLAAGFVDHATLPCQSAARETSLLLADENEGRRALQYGTTQGDLEFRQSLVALIEQNEGVARGTFAEAVERTVVSTGSQQLLYLVAEALIDPGDIVLVESPTYFVFLGLLKTRGATVLGVATDDDGLRPDALEGILSDIAAQGKLDRVKLIYTVSEHANPTGLSLAADRRRELVAIARRWSTRHRIFVLEDAAYRGLWFEEPEPSSVWRFDRQADTVILARTFSKTFSPGLRTGYGVLPEPLLAPVLNLKSSHDFGSPNFFQPLLARVLGEGDYAHQVELMRTTYRRKRDVMLQALGDHFCGQEATVSWTEPTGGLYVWLTLPEGIDTGRDGVFFARCLEHGVLYVPGALCFADGPVPPPVNQARLTFGVADEAALVEGVRRLAAALSDCLAPVA